MTIRQVKGPRGGTKYRLVSQSGKNLGEFRTKAAAQKREKQVQFFKHKGSR